MNKPSLLLVSDDAVLGEALEDCLKQAGFELHCIAEKEDAASAAQKFSAQLVMLDVPAGRQGVSPRALAVPLLVLGEAAEGAGAAMPKPLRISVLVPRIRELLQKQAEVASIDVVPGCVFLPTEKLLRNTKTGAEELLTEKEVDILRLLHAERPRVISREDLLARGWGYAPDITTHTLETHIYRLRGKIRQVMPGQDWIESRDGGYAFIPSQTE